MSLIDRLDASRELYDLATEYRAEAWRWARSECRIELLHNARVCEEAARRALGTCTLAEADAIIEAARAGIARVVSMRALLSAAYAPSREGKGQR